MQAIYLSDISVVTEVMMCIHHPADYYDAVRSSCAPKDQPPLNKVMQLHVQCIGVFNVIYKY